MESIRRTGRPHLAAMLERLQEKVEALDWRRLLDLLFPSTASTVDMPIISREQVATQAGVATFLLG